MIDTNETSSTPDLDQIRLTTQAWPWLQGLTLAPVGLISMALVVPSAWAVLAFPLAGLLVYAARRYYDRTMGRARPRLGAPLPLLVGLAVFLLVYFVARRVTGEGALFATAALASLRAFWPRGVPRIHYAVMAAVLWILSVCAVLAALPGREVWAMGNLSFGLLFVLGGIFDHLVLMRRLRPLAREADEPAL